MCMKFFLKSFFSFSDSNYHPCGPVTMISQLKKSLIDNKNSKCSLFTYFWRTMKRTYWPWRSVLQNFFSLSTCFPHTQTYLVLQEISFPMALAHLPLILLYSSPLPPNFITNSVSRAFLQQVATIVCHTHVVPSTELNLDFFSRSPW